MLNKINNLENSISNNFPVLSEKNIKINKNSLDLDSHPKKDIQNNNDKKDIDINKKYNKDKELDAELKRCQIDNPRLVHELVVKNEAIKSLENKVDELKKVKKTCYDIINQLKV